jgi:hypothetical protein
MPTTEDTQLTEALKGLSAGMQADGYALDARRTEAGRIALVISATPDACADCLAPQDVTRAIAATMFQGAGVTVTADEIDVTYPEGSAAH